jgi:hypothetical protein
MADDDKSKSWWHTLPGVITSVAAAITAIGGLVATVKQTGWLDRSATKPAVTSEVAAVTTPASTPNGAAAVADADANAKPVAAGTAGAVVSAAAAPLSVTLPAIREFRLQHVDGSKKASFSLLKADVSPRNAETKLLKIRVRVLNEDRYPMNFWGDSFRLLVDGAPRQPDQAPNEVLQSNAAADADLVFAVPRDAQSVKLRLLHAEETAEIALELGAGR